MRIGRCKKAERILHFEDAASFNRALDTNSTIREGLRKLAEQLPQITEADYVAGVLRLFHNAGLELSEREFRMLLLLRRQTDQILLQKDTL